jgi:biotin transport system permease protein
VRNPLTLGIHVPGDTIWHRIPAGPKLVGLVLVGIGVIALRGPWPPVATLVLAVGINRWAGVPTATTLRGLRPFLVVVAILAAFQTWQRGWPVAVEVVATTITLVVAATTYTATTPMDDLVGAIVRGLRPFRRIGVRPQKVALAFSLMITAVPTVSTVFHETRDAARARGLERSVRANLVPFAIRVVAHAYATGDALAARGLDD